MPSKNITAFTAICAILLTAILFGIFRNNPAGGDNAAAQKPTVKNGFNVPDIGKIQVLNGCGGAGAADDVTDFLRTNKFDVKNKGNATSFNYPFTLVISRIKDMTIAQKVAEALHTDHIVLVRNEDPAYDATVIIGRDYKERIR
jgi:hypothetical protein